MIESIATMQNLPTSPDEWTMVWVEDIEKIMVYVNGNWSEYGESEEHDSTKEDETVSGNNMQLNLYEINRQIVAQLPEFAEEQWDGAMKVLEDWMTGKHNEYFLLYGREINYFTLFKKSASEDSLKDCIKECLQNIGPTKAFDIAKDNGAIEIWAEFSGITTCLYLFEYDDGVIPCEW